MRERVKERIQFRGGIIDVKGEEPRSARERDGHKPPALIIYTALEVTRDLVDRFLGFRCSVRENLRGFKFGRGRKRGTRHRSYENPVHVGLRAEIWRRVRDCGFLSKRQGSR